MHRTRIFAVVLVLAAMASSVTQPCADEPLPEPPKPPASAKQQLPPPPGPAPARGLPAPPVAGPLTIGSIVTGPVELYPHVRVKDATHAAPGAVPVVIAVRDPNPCRKEPAGIVFVRVCVPPCPLCKVRVNKYGTHLELDYGKYEIEFRSRDGVVTVDYDD